MKIFAGLMVVISIALYSVWPMVEKPDRVADYGKDGMFLAAIQMNWHKKISDYIRGNVDIDSGFFAGYFFYAEKSVLAFSDMLFVTSIFGYWLVKLSNNPNLGSGMALVMGQLLTMVISYAIFVKWSKNVWGGVIGSAAFGLSQIHFMYQVHLHTWTMQYWLLGYWLFGQKKYLLSGLFLGLQMWESPLGTYFGLFLICSHILTFGCLSFDQLISKFRHLIIFGLTFGLIAVWPARAYWEVSSYYHYVRTIRDAAHHSISVNDLDGFVSPGLFLLFGFSLVQVFKNRHSRFNKNLKFICLLIVCSYVLALGPALKWSGKTVKIGGVVPIPMPYAAAYYAIPGWQAFRVPSRWLVISGWGAAGLIAMSFSHLNLYPLSFKKTVGILGICLVAILGGTRIIRYVDLPRVVPQEYLADDEVLTFKPTGEEGVEIERMYFSILAGKKTMNGYSGFVPRSRVKYLNEN